MVMSFNIGDLVYIQAPIDWDEWPEWTDEMDEEVDQDKVHTIRYISGSGYHCFVEVKELGYSFNTSWLKLADGCIPSVSKESKYYKVIKKIKQLDRKFQNRKELSNGF